MPEDQFLTESDAPIVSTRSDSVPEREKIRKEITDAVRGQIRTLETSLSRQLNLDRPINEVTGTYIDTFLNAADRNPVQVREGKIGNVHVSSFSGGPSNETAQQAARETLQQLMDGGAAVKVFGAQVSIVFRSLDGVYEYSYSHGTPVVNSSKNSALAHACKGIEISAHNIKKQILITPNSDGTDGFMILTRNNESGLFSDVSIFSPNPFLPDSSSAPLSVRRIRGQGSIGGSYQGINASGDTSLSGIVVTSPDGERRRWEGRYDHRRGNIVWDRVIQNRNEVDREGLPTPTVVNGDVAGTLVLLNNQGSRVGQIRIHENIFNHIPQGTSTNQEQPQIPEKST